MPDNKSDRRPQDSSRIALEQEHELRYWTQRLGCTEEELREAVSNVGNGANAVREYLESKRGNVTP
jgi:hypothetical protein